MGWRYWRTGIAGGASRWFGGCETCVLVLDVGDVIAETSCPQFTAPRTSGGAYAWRTSMPPTLAPGSAGRMVA
jgi:hypothetical protein